MGERLTVKAINATELRKGDCLIERPRSSDSQAVLVVAEVEQLSYERKAIEGGASVPFVVAHLAEPPDTGENEYVRVLNMKPDDVIYVVDWSDPS